MFVQPHVEVAHSALETWSNPNSLTASVGGTGICF